MNHDNSSFESSLIHEDNLVQENIIKTSFITLPVKDEILKIYDDLSPKKCLSSQSILEQEDDIINTLDLIILYLPYMIPFLEKKC